MKNLLAVSALTLLCACPVPAVTKCEVDSGTQPPPADAGAPAFEVRFRFVNLGRETVTVTLEGEDAGEKVPALGSVAKTGHVTLIKQRGSVQARNFLADGGKEVVSLPFEFDTDGGPATFVLVDTTPSRISMNVTVPKQTQGATFGDRVRQGLAGVDLEGGVDFDGDCAADLSAPAGTVAKIGLHGEPGQDCPAAVDNDFVRPGEVDEDATPYFIRGNDGEVQVAWVGRMKAGLEATGGILANGSSLRGAAIPGGVLITGATPGFYILNAHSSALPATISMDGIEVARDLAPGALIRVKPSLLAAVARKGIQENGLRVATNANIAIGASVGSVALGGILGPCRPPYLCDFLTGEDTLLVVSENLESSATVLKTRHDTVKNSVGNIRRQIAFATTSSIETRGCVSVFPTDDTCVMGAAAIPAGTGGPLGGASAASYAATGRLLYPPKAAAVAGQSMRMVVEENGIVATRFDWANPAGVTPVVGKTAGGFAIVASGSVLDATAGGKRALFFVNTAATPWSVQSSLSL